MSTILNIVKVNKSFGGVKALIDFTCAVESNEIVGLIGPNGAGKSTLFNVITNILKCDSGNIVFSEKYIVNYPQHRIVRLGVSRTFQELRLIKQLPVLDNVLLWYNSHEGENLAKIFFRSKHIAQIEKHNKEKAIELLKHAGIEEKTNDLAGTLSYGQQKLLSLVCCLAADSKLLLLDEPIAGINPEMKEKILSIIEELPSKGKSAIIIEHDMDFIMRICDRLIFMDAGVKICEGIPEEVRNDPRVIEAYID